MAESIVSDGSVVAEVSGQCDTIAEAHARYGLSKEEIIGLSGTVYYFVDDEHGAYAARCLFEEDVDTSFMGEEVGRGLVPPRAWMEIAHFVQWPGEGDVPPTLDQVEEFLETAAEGGPCEGDVYSLTRGAVDNNEYSVGHCAAEIKQVRICAESTDDIIHAFDERYEAGDTEKSQCLHTAYNGDWTGSLAAALVADPSEVEGFTREADVLYSPEFDPHEEPISMTVGLQLAGPGCHPSPWVSANCLKIGGFHETSTDADGPSYVRYFGLFEPEFTGITTTWIHSLGAPGFVGSDDSGASENPAPITIYVR